MSFSVAQSPYRSSFQGRSSTSFFRLFIMKKKRKTGIHSGVLYQQSFHCVKDHVFPSFLYSGRGVFSVKEKKLYYHVTPLILILSFVAIVTFMVLAYLAYSSDARTKGYELERLEKKQQELRQEYDIIYDKIAQAKALHNVSQSDLTFRMYRAQNTGITYVNNDSVLASR